MRVSGSRRPLLRTALFVAVSVLLFACGRSGEDSGAAISGDAPEATRTAPAPEPPPVEAVGTQPGHESGPAPDAGHPPAGTVEPAPSAPLAVVEPPESTAAVHSAREADSAQDGADTMAAAPQAEPAPSPGPRVYTNKDLARYAEVRKMFGFDGPPARQAEMVSGGGDRPGTRVTNEAGLSPEEWRREVAATQAEIARLEQDLANLEKRIPSLRNPFLPRAPVEESDAKVEAGMDNVQRLAHVEERIAETRGRLEEARGRLADLERNRPDGSS